VALRCLGSAVVTQSTDAHKDLGSVWLGYDMSVGEQAAPPLRYLAAFKGIGYDKGRPYIV